MATATQTKPTQSTAPVSKAPPAGTAAKSNPKPSTGTVTKIISDPGMVLDGLKITVENDPAPTEQVSATPGNTEDNTQPQVQVTTTLGFFNEETPTLAVWNRAVEKSAGRKVTGKAVEESIVEVLGEARG